MKLVAAILYPVQIARLCENLGEPIEAPPVQPSGHQAQTRWEFADQAAEFVEPPAAIAPAASPDSRRCRSDGEVSH